MAQFDGEIAFITGAGAGIGRATAELMAERGADVVVHDIKGEAAEGTAELVRKAGRRALISVCDVADIAVMRAEIAKAEAAMGRIDVLVNNAGISGRRLLIDQVDEEIFGRMLSIMVKGSFFATQAVVRGMKARKRGAIVNIVSELCMMGSSNGSHYTGTKSALLGLTKAWAKEFAPFQIRVNAVAPGLTDTNLPLPQTKTEGVKEIPMGRLGRPREIAHAIAYLASDEASFVTGQLLSPNGGIIAGI